MKFTNFIGGLALLTSLAPAALAGQAGEKDFQWYCESPEATPAQKHTVAAIYKAAEINQENVSCHDAFIMLNKRFLFLLQDAGLTDLAPISGFKWMNYLSLGDNNLESIKTLPGSDTLTGIGLINNKIAEFPDFSRFPALKYIYLINNPTTSIPSVDGIRQVTRLILTQTAIADLSHIGELKLTELGISMMTHPGVLDTVPAMASLKKIGLFDMKVSDLNFIERFPNLTSLNLGYNNLTHLNGIEKLKGITFLNLNRNKVESIPEGISFGKISYLGLIDNPIKDFSFLTKIENIDDGDLGLGETSFADWQLIERHMASLRTLDLRDTPLAEVVIPEGQKVEWLKLTELNLSGTKIRSLAFFKQVSAPKLKEFKGPALEVKNETTCPTKGVPAAVAAFCQAGS